MKKRILPLLLALSLVMSLPALAIGAEDFKNGQLSGMTETADGALLVTDVYNKVVWRVKGGKVEQYAGKIGVPGITGEPTGAYLDAAVDKAFFMEPWDVVPFLEGCVISDTGNHLLRYVAKDAKTGAERVYTLAGTGKEGSKDGQAKTASFNRPTGLAVDKDGLLYVCDTDNGAIRRVDKTGKVTTVTQGLIDPTGLCWYDGSLYVAETGRSRICRVTNGVVQTFAGVSRVAEDTGEYYGGYVDGPAEKAQFDHPMDVAAGADGTIYVSDTGNRAVRAIRDGRVYTLERGAADKTMPVNPAGLAVQGGTLLVADRFAGSLMSISLAEKTYADVPAGAWFAAAVESATRNSIASGVSAAKFDPEGSMNRAMFVTMLSRLHKLTNGTVIIDGDATFPDVPAGEWYGTSVRWAADGKIVTGNDDGTFAPLRNISRQELAAMLYRYAKAQGLDVSASDSAFLAFSDAGDTAEWATEAMSWACTKGVLKGDDLGRLTPKANATRAQALTMLLNFMNAYSL